MKHGARTHQVFDEQNLLASAGLVLLIRLAQRCGLDDLVGSRVEMASSAPQAKGYPGVDLAGKITAVVAGMAAGADSIEEMALIRSGGWAGCSVGCIRRRVWVRTCEPMTEAAPATRSSHPALLSAI